MKNLNDCIVRARNLLEEFNDYCDDISSCLSKGNLVEMRNGTIYRMMDNYACDVKCESKKGKRKKYLKTKDLLNIVKIGGVPVEDVDMKPLLDARKSYKGKLSMPVFRKYIRLEHPDLINSFEGHLVDDYVEWSMFDDGWIWNCDIEKVWIQWNHHIK